jgi:restriction system protein
LIPSGSLGVDFHVLDFLRKTKTASEFEAIQDSFEWLRRLLRNDGPWEGITWILDLLPNKPSKAVDALDAYILAHIQIIPDGRMAGLKDAEAIIRLRYFHKGNPREALLDLRPTEFEYLIADLYYTMGYEVAVTRRRRTAVSMCW